MATHKSVSSISVVPLYHLDLRRKRRETQTLCSSCRTEFLNDDNGTFLFRDGIRKDVESRMKRTKKEDCGVD